MKFPARFEIENVDPLKCRVKLVQDLSSEGVFMFENMAEFEILVGSAGFVGPMADQHEGELVVRFESQEVYERLSA